MINPIISDNTSNMKFWWNVNYVIDNRTIRRVFFTRDKDILVFIFSCYDDGEENLFRYTFPSIAVAYANHQTNEAA